MPPKAAAKDAKGAAEQEPDDDVRKPGRKYS
jgi:hypothetical protein